MIRATVTGATLGDFKDIIRDEEAKTLLDLHRGLVLASPVDTGVFRAGWTVDTTAGTIENATAYAEAVANGHSPQAPIGWVEDQMDKASKA